jgi:ankyrin repeat protein
VSKAHPKAVIDALYSGDLKVIERYINKENINWVDENGDSLLSMAVSGEGSNMNIIRLLIKQGAEVNFRLRDGGTLLHFAAHLLRKDLAAVLLRAGCNPNATDDAGQAARAKVLFAFNPKADMIALLLEHGADPTMKQAGSESALELAARTGQNALFPRR